MSRIVSDRTQKVFMQLVAWECFGEELDPKALLQSVPLEDLKKVSENIKAAGTHLKNFACVSMVELELLFKSGMLSHEWSYTKTGDKITISYEPVSFPKQQVESKLTDIGLEHMEVGALA